MIAGEVLGDISAGMSLRAANSTKLFGAIGLSILVNEEPVIGSR